LKKVTSKTLTHQGALNKDAIAANKAEIAKLKKQQVADVDKIKTLNSEHTA
tara:strand:+ start:967 stop:1119 length:153 start_codon:yes stop_codon:yes gene_type:complete